jgi:hypothetical protein
VVKRLPWTHLILQKVKKISLELLKFTSKGWWLTPKIYI